ncbi:hypothetical protein [Bullifex porci]|uniref:hypothetical protein n=1 Tax=Bullifex porci TaxID=2606638 RepID=UPI0023F088CC|nr:hypothetical protein [Bullifex porci]MDD7256626.1 hypothetical protein [Bullifex porci]MDY2740638.1 hypothetical protein [Bullifex porci]
MNKVEKKIYTISALLIVVTTVLTFFLPNNISLTLTGGREKSKYYLILLSLIPLVTAYIISISKLSYAISISFLIFISFYIALIVLSSFGIAIPVEAIVLFILGLCMLAIALLIRKEDSKVKINLKYVTSELIYKRLQKAGCFMFLTLSLEMLLFSILIFLKLVKPSIAIPVILITGFVYALIILKISIKNK